MEFPTTVDIVTPYLVASHWVSLSPYEWSWKAFWRETSTGPGDPFMGLRSPFLSTIVGLGWRDDVYTPPLPSWGDIGTGLHEAHPPRDGNAHLRSSDKVGSTDPADVRRPLILPTAAPKRILISGREGRAHKQNQTCEPCFADRDTLSQRMSSTRSPPWLSSPVGSRKIATSLLYLK